MKKVLFFLALSYHFVLSAQTPTPPPLGCGVYTVFDSDNDGFAQFDLDAYFTQFRNEMLTYNFDLSGYTFEFYPSETDLNNGTNLITVSPYTNIVSYSQFCSLKFIHSGTGPLYGVNELDYPFMCHKLETTSVLATIDPTQDLLSVYPNPASTTININFGKQQEFAWTISDMSGKIILESKSQNQPTIDVSVLKSGIYIINVTANATTTTKKLMIL